MAEISDQRKISRYVCKNESHGEKCDASSGRAAPPLSVRD